MLGLKALANFYCCRRKEDGCKDEGRAAETVSGDAKGTSDGAKGGKEKSFKLESATAEEIKGAETRRKERAEIKKRQNAPLKKSRVSFKNEAEAKNAAKALPAIDFMSELDYPHFLMKSRRIVIVID